VICAVPCDNRNFALRSPHLEVHILLCLQGHLDVVLIRWDDSHLCSFAPFQFLFEVPLPPFARLNLEFEGGTSEASHFLLFFLFSLICFFFSEANFFLLSECASEQRYNRVFMLLGFGV